MGSIDEPQALPTYINYYLHPNDGGTHVVSPGAAGDWLRKHERHAVQVRNMRERSGFSVDTSGFQLVSGLPQARLDAMAGNDFGEVIDVIKRIMSATRVIPFNHVVRKDTLAEVEGEARRLAYYERGSKAGPAMWAHIDQSDQGAPALMRHITPAGDRERLSRGRWAIVNVWQPLAPVLREPLAVCDARSLPEEDLRVTAIEHGDIRHIKSAEGKQAAPAGAAAARPRGELYQIAYRSTHEWWYVKDMQADEALLLKIYDSKSDGRARRCAHTAFEFPGQDSSAPARTSVEVRCLVFWEDDESNE